MGGDCRRAASPHLFRWMISWPSPMAPSQLAIAKAADKAIRRRCRCAATLPNGLLLTEAPPSPHQCTPKRYAEYFAAYAGLGCTSPSRAALSHAHYSSRRLMLLAPFQRCSWPARRAEDAHLIICRRCISRLLKSAHNDEDFWR